MNRNMIMKYVFMVILAASATVAKAENELVKDMVYLDQVYIPVLALTSAENVKASRLALASFEPVWNAFKSKYYSMSGNDTEWKADFEKVDGYIQTGKNIILRGVKIKRAHMNLEHVRVIFMHLRERNNIEYYIDHLTRFHEPMEKIVLAVKGKTDATLTDEDISFIKSTLPEATKRWNRLSDTKFDDMLFEFSEDKTAMLNALVEKQRGALVNLQRALNEGDKKQIIQAGLAIKPNFARLFKLFGHFPNQKKNGSESNSL